MKKIFYLIFIIFFITGCQNYQELNSLAIVTALSIDYDTNNNEYEIVTQVINTVNKDKASSSNEPSFINFKAKAPSLSEALNEVVDYSPRKLYLSQIQVIILSKEILENHLDNTLDYILRNPEIRGEVNIMMAPSEEDLKGISIQTLLDDLSSSNIISSLNESYKEGLTTKVTVDDFSNMYLNPYEEIVLPTIYVEGNANIGKENENINKTEYISSVHIGKTAITKDNKIVRYLDKEETKYLNIIRKDIKNMQINIPYHDEYIVFKLYNLKVKIKPNTKNNKITLTLTGKAGSYEIVTNTSIENENNVKDIEKELNKYLKDNIIDTFKSIRKDNNIDVFNFQNIYYKNNPHYIKNNNWYNDIFPNLKLEVISKIDLYEKGNIKEEIKYVKENKYS